MSNITIKDVAKAANVSIATVSRVINNHNEVSDSLVTRVNSAIDELGYYPNTVARTLKSDKSKTIAFVTSDISNSFFTIMARSIEDVISKYGYNLIVCSTDDSQSRELDYLQLLREKHVDGIIINMTAKNIDYIVKLSQDLPIALFGRSINDNNFIGDFVDTDNETGIFGLTSLLLDKGHRIIGLINGQNYVSSAKERLKGFLKAMKTRNINMPINSPYIYNGHFNDKTSAENGTLKLLSLKNPPTAIISANNMLTLGVISQCNKSNIMIPDQLSLCSFGSLNNSELMCIQPTYADQTPILVGARLATLIIERIDKGNKITNREFRFVPQIINGNSVKNLNN